MTKVYYRATDRILPPEELDSLYNWALSRAMNSNEFCGQCYCAIDLIKLSALYPDLLFWSVRFILENLFDLTPEQTVYLLFLKLRFGVYYMLYRE